MQWDLAGDPATGPRSVAKTCVGVADDLANDVVGGVSTISAWCARYDTAAFGQHLNPRGGCRPGSSSSQPQALEVGDPPTLEAWVAPDIDQNLVALGYQALATGAEPAVITRAELAVAGAVPQIEAGLGGLSPAAAWSEAGHAESSLYRQALAVKPCTPSGEPYPGHDQLDVSIRSYAKMIINKLENMDNHELKSYCALHPSIGLAIAAVGSEAATARMEQPVLGAPPLWSTESDSATDMSDPRDTQSFFF